MLCTELLHQSLRCILKKTSMLVCISLHAHEIIQNKTEFFHDTNKRIKHKNKRKRTKTNDKPTIHSLLKNRNEDGNKDSHFSIRENVHDITIDTKCNTENDICLSVFEEIMEDHHQESEWTVVRRKHKTSSWC